MADLSVTDTFFREQLQSRRRRLESAIASSKGAENLETLLSEVDAALARMETGGFGICEVCHEPVEAERLIADPLVRFCLTHLTADQQTALERDLLLASQIQREMLPGQDLKFPGWEVFYHYRPLGLVSGDYCDVLTHEARNGSLFFVLGDVSGKGVAASMLMAHLQAIFRVLFAAGLAVPDLVERAGSIFCESAMSPYFATLVCGGAGASGEIEICNAGHPAPLVLQGGKVTEVESTGVPLGLFCDGKYSARKIRLDHGDTLFLYTDGLSEARDRSDVEYGESRLIEFARGHHALAPGTLVSECLKDLSSFLSETPLTDDLTLMAIRRTA
ncbi:MAG: SpoIIE family protein phosphatase [Acidobacteriota bacterium]|nr:SpoIIE family protein phosphatase [Acidobacteriota bacterium]